MKTINTTLACAIVVLITSNTYSQRLHDNPFEYTSPRFQPTQPFRSFAADAIVADDGDELRNLTIGLGAGYNYLFKDQFDYSLSTDSIGVLKIQELTRSNFVISSVVVFRLGSPEAMDEGNSLAKTKVIDDDAGTPKKKVVPFKDRLALNLSINLLDLGADNVSFNKFIDGGLGIGVFVNSYAQLGVFYELSRYRQMRDHIVSSYRDQPIPKGIDFYNALDQSDNQLFYTATTSSISFKAIFTIPAKKE